MAGEVLLPRAAGVVGVTWQDLQEDISELFSDDQHIDVAALKWGRGFHMVARHNDAIPRARKPAAEDQPARKRAKVRAWRARTNADPVKREQHLEKKRQAAKAAYAARKQAA
jgi:ribosomal protein L3